MTLKRREIVCDEEAIMLLKDNKLLFETLYTACHVFALPQIDTVKSASGPSQLTMHEVKLKLSDRKKVTLIFQHAHEV